MPQVRADGVNLYYEALETASHSYSSTARGTITRAGCPLSKPTFARPSPWSRTTGATMARAATCRAKAPGDRTRTTWRR